MKTVIVTGGAGFIGSHLIDRLLSKKYKVFCIDSFDSFYPRKFKEENIQNARKNKNFKLYEVDIRNVQESESILRKHSPIDSLIHLAAKAGVRPSIEKPLLYQKTNVSGTANLLKLAAKYKVKQFIFASSSSVYGNAKVPFLENLRNLIPLSPYGKTKLEAEELCKAFHQKYQLPTTVLRLFSVYGPRGRPDMAPYLFTKAAFENLPIKQYGDGSSARDWTYIDDITKGIVKTLEKPFSFEIINLGGNKPIQLKDLIKLVEKISRKKIKKIILPKKAEEPNITFASIEKAKRLLDWQPETDFSKGMKKFINWFKTNRLKLILNQ